MGSHGIARDRHIAKNVRLFSHVDVPHISPERRRRVPRATATPRGTAARRLASLRRLLLATKGVQQRAYKRVDGSLLASSRAEATVASPSGRPRARSGDDRSDYNLQITLPFLASNLCNQRIRGDRTGSHGIARDRRYILCYYFLRLGVVICARGRFSPVPSRAASGEPTRAEPRPRSRAAERRGDSSPLALSKNLHTSAPRGPTAPLARLYAAARICDHRSVFAYLVR